MNDAVATEEDGDEIFTPMPEHCLICMDQPKLKTEKGFQVCPRCGSSYGRYENSQTKN